MVILQSAIASIGTDVLESAEIDGANGVQKALYITLPLIKKYGSLSALPSVLQVNMKAFDNIFVMTKAVLEPPPWLWPCMDTRFPFNQSNMGYEAVFP